MNTRVTSLLRTAIFTGMLASQAAKAEEFKKTEGPADKSAVAKTCDHAGHAEKGECCSGDKKKLMKKDGSSSCGEKGKCGKGKCGAMTEPADAKPAVEKPANATPDEAKAK